MQGAALSAHLAAADVFVFTSKTDTFGVVQLEALACGVPVAAYPVMGPRDVVGNSPVGVLDNDLRVACLGALKLSPMAASSSFSHGDFPCSSLLGQQPGQGLSRRPAGRGR